MEELRDPFFKKGGGILFGSEVASLRKKKKMYDITGIQDILFDEVRRKG
jgi:hypothetical protein